MDHVLARITGDSRAVITCDAVFKDPAAVALEVPLQASNGRRISCSKIRLTMTMLHPGDK